MANTHACKPQARCFQMTFVVVVVVVTISSQVSDLSNHYQTLFYSFLFLVTHISPSLLPLLRSPSSPILTPLSLPLHHHVGSLSPPPHLLLRPVFLPLLAPLHSTPGPQSELKPLQGGFRGLWAGEHHGSPPPWPPTSPPPSAPWAQWPPAPSCPQRGKPFRWPRAPPFGRGQRERGPRQPPHAGNAHVLAALGSPHRAEVPAGNRGLYPALAHQSLAAQEPLGPLRPLWFDRGNA